MGTADLKLISLCMERQPCLTISVDEKLLKVMKLRLLLYKAHIMSVYQF